MKSYLFLLTFCFFTYCFGQNKKEMQVIYTAKTDKHISVEGTKISLIPPDEFVQVYHYSGFEHEKSGSSILVFEIPGPFSKIFAEMNEEKLQSQEMKLISMEELSFNDKKAIFLKVTKSAKGLLFLGQVLAFGDEQKTFVLSGNSSMEAKNLEIPIKNAIFSAIYEEDKAVNPLENAGFSVDVKDTKFQFAHALAGMFMYSTDGKMPTLSEDKSFFMVGNSLGNDLIADKKEFAIRRLKQLPGGESAKIEKTEAIEIDGLKGYALTAYQNAEMEGKELFYQIILFKENLYYIFLGTAKSDFEENIQLFKKISLTFRRK